MTISCGSSDPGGPPGSIGADKTNVIVLPELSNPASVDICNGSDSIATVDLLTETVNPALPENRLYLEGYTVEFTPQTGGAPPIAKWTASKTKTLPATGLELLFIDSGRKLKYHSDVTSGGYSPANEFPTYDVKYVFHGKDDFGNDFGASASGTFRMGKFGGCESPVSVSPSSISVTGIAYPDNDPSDDVTFSISGGTGPYTVYSDNAAVIPAPGALGAGITQFTIDPDSVAAPAEITLTVLDSKGATSTIKVTVK